MIVTDISIGDLVSWNLDQQGGTNYVFGVMSYSNDVVCVGSDQHIGMPIHRRYCRVESRGHLVEARRLYDRYDGKFPGALAPFLLSVEMNDNA